MASWWNSSSPPLPTSRSRPLSVLVTTDQAVAGTSAVTVIDTSTGTQIGTTLTLTGITNYVPPIVAADGTHAIITTADYTSPTGNFTTVVTVIDGTTGTPIGSTTLAGRPGRVDPPLLSSDGTHALVTTVDDASSSSTPTSRVAVINTTTGAQTGTTITLDGNASSGPLPVLSADGTRAVVVASNNVAIIDVSSGTQMGDTFTFEFGADTPLLNADGSRALITTSSNSPSGVVTRIVLIDTSTGAYLNDATQAGQYGSRLLNADGDHAVVTTVAYDSAISADTNLVAVYDMSTGDQIGTTATVAGQYGTRVHSADGTRLLITAFNAGNTTKTQVAVINTATGAEVGSLTLAGSATGSATLTDDGTRALIATVAGSYTHVAVLRIVRTTDGSVRASRGWSSTRCANAAGPPAHSQPDRPATPRHVLCPNGFRDHIRGTDSS